MVGKPQRPRAHSSVSLAYSFAIKTENGNEEQSALEECVFEYLNAFHFPYVVVVVFFFFISAGCERRSCPKVHTSVHE